MGEGMGQRSLKIGFRVGTFPKVSETFIRDQIRSVSSRGHIVSVLADRPDHSLINQDEYNWLSELSTLRYLNDDEKALSKLMQQLPTRVRNRLMARAERAFSTQNDIVVCNFGWFGQSFALSRPGYGAAKIVTIFHGADMSTSITSVKDNPYRILFARGDLHLPISELWRDRLIKLGAPKDRVFVHRMGVDLNKFQFKERHVPVGEPFRIVTVGRLVEKKGLEFALRSIALVLKREPELSLAVDIIGDGPLKDELISLANSLGLSEVVRFRGRVSHDEVSRVLAASHAFMLPSVTAADGDMEGVPVALMEAMASGLPVISTRHSGIPELIEHGLEGLLADERDIDGLADILLQTTKQQEESLMRAQAARKKIVAQFNSAVLSDELEQRLQSVIDLPAAAEIGSLM